MLLCIILYFFSHWVRKVQLPTRPDLRLEQWRTLLSYTKRPMLINHTMASSTASHLCHSTTTGYWAITTHQLCISSYA